MRCPLCQTEKCNVNKAKDGITQIECSEYNTKVQCFFSNYDIDADLYTKLLNLICEIIVKKPKAPNDLFWSFYYDSSEKRIFKTNEINLFSLLKNYPHSIIDITDRALINLSYKFPTFGEEIIFWDTIANLFFVKNNDDRYYEAEGVIKMLAQLGYLIDNGRQIYSISAEGWKKIDNLQKEQAVIDQGFVAMRFCNETQEIREAFRQGIVAAGYSMRAIDEKEHNNQIVPEIFCEIERSKFVVVDVTYPNYGAYYEAGYAQGLGKQVIVCCKKEVFEDREGNTERPHFDISQKSMVIWNDIEDLKKG